MLQAAIAGLILLGIYKFIDTKSEYEIDWWMSFLFIFAPSIVIFLLNIGIGIAGINPMFALFGYVFYFIFPLLFLKLGLDFETKPAMKVAAWVPIVAILTEIPFVFLMQAPSA